MLERGVGLARHRQALAMNVGGAAQAVRDHARRDGLVGRAVDQDEGAGFAILGIGVVGDRHGRGDIGEADLVERQRLGGELVEIVDVDAVLELGHRRRRRARADLHEIGAAGQQRLGAHPDEMRGELIGDFRAARRGAPARRRARCRSRRRASASPPRPPPLRPPRGRRLRIARHRALPARGGDDDRVAAADDAAGDRPGEAAKIEMRPVDPLHRQAERRAAGGPLRLRRARDGRRAAARHTRACARSSRRCCRRSGPRSGSPASSGSRAARRTSANAATMRRNVASS